MNIDFSKLCEFSNFITLKHFWYTYMCIYLYICMYERDIKIEYLFISDVATNNKRRRINILHTFYFCKFLTPPLFFNFISIYYLNIFLNLIFLERLCNFWFSYKWISLYNIQTKCIIIKSTYILKFSNIFKWWWF